MDYNDNEYLKLFKQIKDDSQPLVETRDYSFDQLRVNTNSVNNYQMINETPQYANYENFRSNSQYGNINEVQRQNYSQDYNLNEFNIETRYNDQNINEVRRQEKEQRLNEVMQQMRQARLNEVKQTENINENVNFKDASIVTLEMFEKARYNSMMQVAYRILPK